MVPNWPALRIAGIYALFGFGWILVSDQLMLSLAPEIAVFSQLGTWKGLLFVLGSAFVIYLVAHRPAAQPTVPADERFDDPGMWPLILVFAVLAGVIVLVGLGGVAYTAGIQKEREIERLRTIAALKVDQIEAWLGERKRDARSLRDDAALADLYRQWRERGDVAARAKLQKRLESFRASFDYPRVVLLDENGTSVLAAGDKAHVDSDALRAAVRRAVAQGQVQSTDLYRSPTADSGEVHMEFVVPLAALPGQPRIAIALDTDPDRFLFPFVQSWPVPSASGETLLFRRDGEDVLFLNELRHRSGTALKQRMPLAQKDLLAAQVIEGRVAMGGPVDGVDYRGMPVLGVARAIEGTTWFLIAKLDKDEIYAQAKRDAAWIVLAVTLSLIVSGAAARLVHRRRELRLARIQRRQQDEKLRALQLLDAIAEGSNDVIFARDVFGRHLLFNEAAARFVGRRPDEVLGKDVASIFPHGEADRILALDRHVMAENHLHTSENVLTSAEGTKITFLTTLGPLHDAQGKVTGLFGIARDITERKQAEEQLRKLAQAVEQSPESIVITDLDAHIEYVNEAFTRASGYTRDDVIGQDPRVLQSGQTPAETYEELWAALAAGRVWQGEFINRRKNGELYCELATISPVRQPDGRVTHYLAVKEDITEKKRTSEELERHRHHLQELVAERTAELERANREMESFSYSVSHDLRAPLRAINGFAHILLDAEYDSVSAEGREHLDRIMRNAAKMGQLIDDILAFSRISRAQMNRQNVQLGDVAQAALRELAADYPKSQVSIAELPPASGDETMLLQVFANLISNALKYSALKEHPEVHIGAMKRDGEDVYFVRDNGAGFDMQYAGRLFGVFQRMHTDAEFLGTGVGLAIVKHIVERHGGRVWAEAVRGEGATFYFTLGHA